ncbi:TPA: hypothetical protein PXM28_003423 [Yersinia enterocolitica]|nr:hypothetical protein [Yersinia enterocolitica]
MIINEFSSGYVNNMSYTQEEESSALPSEVAPTLLSANNTKVSVPYSDKNTEAMIKMLMNDFLTNMYSSEDECSYAIIPKQEW